MPIRTHLLGLYLIPGTPLCFQGSSYHQLNTALSVALKSSVLKALLEVSNVRGKDYMKGVRWEGILEYNSSHPDFLEKDIFKQPNN